MIPSSQARVSTTQYDEDGTEVTHTIPSTWATCVSITTLDQEETRPGSMAQAIVDQDVTLEGITSTTVFIGNYRGHWDYEGTGEDKTYTEESMS